LKHIFFLSSILLFSIWVEAQAAKCVFKKPLITIHFGSGYVQDMNTDALYNYERVRSSCPTDGHYTYSSYTSDCFSGDWFTLTEDHTSGDASGNMLLVNSSYSTGTFFKTVVEGLKGGTTYEFGVWLMNVCRITDKCPYPLLPNISIRLQTPSGKTVAQFSTGEIVRHPVPHWTQHRAIFTTPASETKLLLVMTNNKPGGCGNDFALDDITFRECVISKVPAAAVAKTTTPTKKPAPPVKPVAKKATPTPEKKQPAKVEILKPQKDTQVSSPPVVKVKPRQFPPPPAVLRRRENTVVKQIETETGEITVNLYDNGEIDGDTISVYHNNVLVMAHARLSQKPISISIAIDPSQPHHELIMVAENLGSIPPNTSLMVITAGSRRYEVFISSNEQRNAKVVFDLKE
jgi:hypothetical protein